MAINSQVYRLKVAALLNPDTLPLLKACYGKEEALFNAAQEIFEQANDALQGEKKKFTHLRFSWTRAAEAAKASFGLAGGHRKRKLQTDRFQKVHAQWTGEREIKDSKMFCSEFVAKSLLAALIETDMRLKEVARNLIEQRKDLSEEQKAQHQQFLNEPDTHLLKLPFDSKERLKRIHPGRIIPLLNKTPGALTKVDPLPFIQHIFSDLPS
ncbi:MAG: hypothetical protein K0S07_835 [Chlamydiales bacterium]|nr:hypothetical protein [Chlamydiales bacterium]